MWVADALVVLRQDNHFGRDVKQGQADDDDEDDQNRRKLRQCLETLSSVGNPRLVAAFLGAFFLVFVDANRPGEER